MNLWGRISDDVDRVKRSLGVTPYLWQVHFLGTGEVAERERAFGSPEQAFYNMQNYLVWRVMEEISGKGDLVTLTIKNTATGETVKEIRNRQLEPGQRHTIGYLTAEYWGSAKPRPKSLF